MSDIPGESIGPEVARPSAQAPRRRRWQVGLRTLFLLMAAIAVWLTVVINRREGTRLETRIRSMQTLAHELKIDDVSRIAVVKLEPLWMDDNRWDLFLPTGEYRLCVASREIEDQGMLPPKMTATLRGGRRRLGLNFGRRGEGWRFRVTSDDAELLTFDETKDWGSSNSATRDADYSQSIQLPADRPLELYRRRYRVKTGPSGTSTPGGPADGLLMWIERVNGSKPSSP